MGILLQEHFQPYRSKNFNIRLKCLILLLVMNIESSFDIDTLRAWDESSVSMLYAHFFRSLVVYAAQIIGDDEAEDIVQEVFSILWERRPEFSSENQLSTYLYRSVRNAAISWQRHETVRERFRNAAVGQANSNVSETDDREEKLRKEEVYRQLMLCIDELPPRQREIFLKCMEGKKNSEIAEQLHISAETVKVQKRRAVRSLRGKLSPAAMSLLLNVAGLYVSEL